jgi:O-antigen ligase
VATPALESTPHARRFVGREDVGALALALAIPPLFVHERFQPELSFALGQTTVDVRLADLAVLAVVITALTAVAHGGIRRLRPALALWLTGAALLGWLAFQALRPVSLDDPAFEAHVITYLKLLEYSLLTVAVPLLVRSRRDLTILVGALVLWCAVATFVALLQFFGLDVFAVSTAGWRYASFLGRHDLAALAALAASAAAAGALTGRHRLPASQLASVALVAGSLGLVLAGSVAAAGGFALGAIALWLAARTRFAPTRGSTLNLASLVVAVVLGIVVIRSATLEDFLRFLGIHGDEAAQGVESYSQRTVLSYIGLRIFLDHPVAGVGWQRSATPEVFEPYVPDARERFPDVVDLAFPAEGREWGVQNLYVQMLADAGVIGLVLLLLVGAAGLVLAWRTAARAPTVWATGAGLLVVCALLTIAGEWASLGIVPGIPLQAATCLLLGLAAAGAIVVAKERGG